MAKSAAKKVVKLTGNPSMTDGGVRSLFQDLSHRDYEIQEALTSPFEERLGKLKEEFDARPEVKALLAAISSLRSRFGDLHYTRCIRVKRLRQRYYAHGLTDSIVGAIQKLVDDCHAEDEMLAKEAADTRLLLATEVVARQPRSMPLDSKEE